MAARSVAPGSSPPVAAARRVRCRGPAGGSPRRSRGRCRGRSATPSASVGRPARSAAGTSARRLRLPDGVVRLRQRPPPAASRRAGGGGLRDLEEPDHVVREEERRLDLVDEHRPLAVHHAQVRAQQPRVLGGRQLEQVSHQRLLVRGMDDDVPDHPAMLAEDVADRHRPMVTRPMVLPDHGTARESGVVEVDHQPDAAVRDPDADPDPVVGGVHQVPVVAAVVGLLALEVQVRAEDGAVRVARPAAEVLAPAVARVARVAQPVAGRPADEVVALVVGREALRVRPRDARARCSRSGRAA